MNKRAKNLIILLAALALVIVAVSVIPGLMSGDKEAPEDTSISLALDAGTLSGISWEHNGGSISLALDADGAWYYEGDPAFPLDQSCPQAMITALGSLTASSKLENPNSLSEYGLDDPSYLITASREDGSTTRLFIGDQNSVTSGYYLTVAGDNTIYVVDSTIVSAFSHELMGMIEMETVDSIDRVSGFTVRNGEQGLEVVYLEGESDDTFWFLVESGGNLLPLGNTAAATVKGNITRITWQSCVDYNVGGDKLAEYGLDDPAVITVRYYTAADDYAEERTVTYQIGDREGDSCYAKLSDSKQVYLIRADTVEKILSADYDSLKLGG